MGLQVHGYPDLFTTGAPLAPSAPLSQIAVEPLGLALGLGPIRPEQAHRESQLLRQIEH